MVNVNHLTDVIVIQAHGFTNDLRFAGVLTQRAAGRTKPGIRLLIPVSVGDPAVAYFHALFGFAKQFNVADHMGGARFRGAGP